MSFYCIFHTTGGQVYYHAPWRPSWYFVPIGILRPLPTFYQISSWCIPKSMKAINLDYCGLERPDYVAVYGPCVIRTCTLSLRNFPYAGLVFFEWLIAQSGIFCVISHAWLLVLLVLVPKPTPTRMNFADYR